MDVDYGDRGSYGDRVVEPLRRVGDDRLKAQRLRRAFDPRLKKEIRHRDQHGLLHIPMVSDARRYAATGSN